MPLLQLWQSGLSSELQGVIHFEDCTVLSYRPAAWRVPVGGRKAGDSAGQRRAARPPQACEDTEKWRVARGEEAAGEAGRLATVSIRGKVPGTEEAAKNPGCWEQYKCRASKHMDTNQPNACTREHARVYTCTRTHARLRTQVFACCLLRRPREHPIKVSAPECPHLGGFRCSGFFFFLNHLLCPAWSPDPLRCTRQTEPSQAPAPHTLVFRCCRHQRGPAPWRNGGLQDWRRGNVFPFTGFIPAMLTNPLLSPSTFPQPSDHIVILGVQPTGRFVRVNHLYEHLPKTN